MQQNTQRTSWRNIRGNDELNVHQTSLTCLCNLGRAIPSRSLTAFCLLDGLHIPAYEGAEYILNDYIALMCHNSLFLLFFSKSEIFNQSAREYMKDHKVKKQRKI